MARGLKSSSATLLTYSFDGEKSMTKLRTAAAKFVRSEEGASLAEYGLLLALIAVVCIAGMTLLGTQINAMFQSLSTTTCSLAGQVRTTPQRSESHHEGCSWTGPGSRQCGRHPLNWIIKIAREFGR